MAARTRSKRRGESDTTAYRDYRVTFKNGVELEVGGCRNVGLAKLLAVDYMRSTRREAFILSCEVISSG